MYGNSELAERIRAILPALSALLGGQVFQFRQRLNRNSAIRAETPGITITDASDGGLRKAQKGPRLDARSPKIAGKAELQATLGSSFHWNPLVASFRLAAETAKHGQGR